VVYRIGLGVDAVVWQTALEPLRVVEDGHLTRHRWRQGPRTRTRSGGNLPVVVGEIERSLIRHLSNHTCSVRSAVRSARVETPVASGRAFRSELRRAGQMLTTRQHYPASGSGRQPSTVGPSSSPRLRLRATRRVPPRLCRRSTITTARQSMPGTRAGDLVALNAPGRASELLRARQCLHERHAAPPSSRTCVGASPTTPFRRVALEPRTSPTPCAPPVRCHPGLLRTSDSAGFRP
jgi:hypothetical protein